MTWNIATAAKRLGITGSAQDADLQAALDAALAMAESYCDRRFMLQPDEDEFTLPCGPSLLVRRYPLVSIATLAPLDPQAATPIDPWPVPATWRLDKKRGIVFMFGAPPWVSPIAPVGSQPLPAGWAGSQGFVLAYTGGYDPLPADLELALWMAFDQVWASTPGWGMPAGSQSSGGAVKGFSIDGMRLDYDNATASGSVGAGRAEAWGLLPANAIGILDSYRAETAALGG